MPALLCTEMRVLLASVSISAFSPAGIVSSMQTNATARVMAPPVSAVRSLLRPRWARMNPRYFIRSRGATDHVPAGGQHDRFAGALRRLALEQDSLVEMIRFIDEAQRARIVGDHHHRLAEVGLQLAQQTEDLLGVARVKIAGRLIGDDEGGIGDDGAGNGDPLLLAARQRARVMVEAVGEADDAQRRFGPLPPLALVEVGEQQR